MTLLKKDRGRTPRNRTTGYPHFRVCLSTTRGRVQRSNFSDYADCRSYTEAVAPASYLSQSDDLDTLVAFTPLRYGDLALLGLTGWTPAGLSSWMLEVINASTGLPWFYTIIAGTIIARLILLPFSNKQLRNSTALAPHQPRLMQLKGELDKAYKTGDKLAVQCVALKQRKVYEEYVAHVVDAVRFPDLTVPDPYYV